MLKKLLKILLKLFILLACVYGVARFVVVFHDSRLTGEREAYIQQLSTNQVTIRWLTEDDSLGVVRYGENLDHLTKIELDEDTTTNHRVVLPELKPDTVYYYQVGDTSGFQPYQPDKYWFKTHPEDEVATRIWVIGDSGEVGETQKRVRDSAFKWMQENPKQGVLEQEVPSPMFDIWLALGDIAYRSGTNEQFQQALFEPFGQILPNIALLPVYGNHDDRRWTYFRIFDVPENGESGGVASETENYYAVDYSNVHFVILDSQASSRSSDGAMARWLKKDLSNNTKPWVVVAFHHPPYSRGSHDSDDTYDSRGRMQDMRENILPILEAYGVDLVLTGHSHMYERSYLIDCAYQPSMQFSENNIVSSGVNNKHERYIKPLQDASHQGAIYVVAGSSSKVDRGPLDHPAHHVGLLEAGSVVIDVVDTKLTARFINDKGSVKDQFSIEKNSAYESDYRGCQL